jgi:hypothetical protein
VAARNKYAAAQQAGMGPRPCEFRNISRDVCACSTYLRVVVAMI